MSRKKQSDGPSFLDAVGQGMKEASTGIKEGLKSQDAPTRRMSFIFVLCVLGTFFTFGVWVNYLLGQRQERQAAQALVKKVAKEAAAEEAAETADLKKIPNMLSLGQFSIELTEKPGIKRAHGMMNLAAIELFVSCDTKDTCEYIEAHKVQIQNQITSFFTPIEREDFLSIAGKRSIRKALVEHLNRWLPEGKLKDVYFVQVIIS